MTNTMTAPKSVEYKCPYEWARCKLKKHCHVLETPDKLPCKITALVKCPIHNNQKIPVEIGT